MLKSDHIFMFSSMLIHGNNFNPKLFSWITSTQSLIGTQFDSTTTKHVAHFHSNLKQMQNGGLGSHFSMVKSSSLVFH